MIHQEHSKYKAVCDNCFESENQDFETFDEALIFTQENGWNNKWVGGHWEHACPECLAKR